jgi:hypothetical protein
MFNFKALTNTRPAKQLGTQIIAAPTSGHIKVTPDAASKLNVSDNSYVFVVRDTISDTIWVRKGEEGVGGKLASSNKSGGGTLTFSSGNAWNDLKGDVNANVHYDMAEEPVYVTAEGEQVEAGTEGASPYFQLTFVASVPKTVRKKRTKKEEEVAEGTNEGTGEVESENQSADYVVDSPQNSQDSQEDSGFGDI